jgi:hypothetical protein
MKDRKLEQLVVTGILAFICGALTDGSSGLLDVQERCLSRLFARHEWNSPFDRSPGTIPGQIMALIAS